MSYGILEQFQQDIEQLQEINRTLVNGTQVLHDYIATLKAERDAARQDTERLDAIERYKLDVRADLLDRFEVPGDWTVFLSDHNWINAPTLREAIDTAIARREDA
jgi:hypothetical protein